MTKPKPDNGVFYPPLRSCRCEKPIVIRDPDVGTHCFKCARRLS